MDKKAIIQKLQNLLNESSLHPFNLLGKFQVKYPEESALLTMMKQVFFDDDSEESEILKTCNTIIERLENL